MEVDDTEVANVVYVHFIKDGAAEDDDMEHATMPPTIDVVKPVPWRMATRSSTSCSPSSTLLHRRDAIRDGDL